MSVNYKRSWHQGWHSSYASKTSHWATFHPGIHIFAKKPLTGEAIPLDHFDTFLWKSDFSKKKCSQELQRACLFSEIVTISILWLSVSFATYPTSFRAASQGMMENERVFGDWRKFSSFWRGIFRKFFFVRRQAQLGSSIERSLCWFRDWREFS